MSWDLNFINREDFYGHVRSTIMGYGETLKSIDLRKFNQNIIDPIKLTFDSNVYGKTFEQIIDDEIFRQRDKTNSNIIGYFHQNIFKYIKNCEVPSSVWDIVFKDHVFVEMKNKHNTMNSSSSAKTYMKMQDKLLKCPDATCFLVEIIARRSQNVVWEVSIDGIKLSNSRIRRVSIDKFYEIVTGDKNAFAKICQILPAVIKEIIDDLPDLAIQKDTVLEELMEIDKDLIKALYLLAFSTYEGF
jgi:hypothetical protein